MDFDAKLQRFVKATRWDVGFGYPRNAVLSQGRAVPIDTTIQRVTPEFAAWVHANKEILMSQGRLR